MLNQYSYGYLKDAVKAHLDLEEEELGLMNINQRFHIFANEAIQHICHNKPKTTYFQFEVVAKFEPLLYDNGILRLATIEEQTAGVSLATLDELAVWYNNKGIYQVGQVITMPDDFISFAVKKAFLWAGSIANKIAANKSHFIYLSNTEIVPYYVATYLIPYQATWTNFAQDTSDNFRAPMPSDLLLTIPIYVASVCLQQRNLAMASAKRQEFEIALSRCKSTSFLENKDITPTFK